MKTFNFNGRSYEYSINAIFYFEIGRLDNAYSCDKLFVTDIENGITQPHLHAIEAYLNFEVSNGWKKRLTMKDGDCRYTLAKQITKRIK